MISIDFSIEFSTKSESEEKSSELLALIFAKKNKFKKCKEHVFAFLILVEK